MQPSDWLIPASSVAVAFVTLGGVVVTAKRSKEPSTSEVWTENSNLRDRLDEQDGKIEGLRSRVDSAEDAVRTIGRGFDVLYRLFGRKPIENLSTDDQTAIEDARKLRETSHR